MSLGLADLATVDQKLYSHTEAAVKRREPTISKLNTQYNKLCGEINKLVKERKAPTGAVAPDPIPPKRLWQLDVDDGIWQDVGLEDDDDELGGQVAGQPPLWLCDEQVRSGIKAMLELDRCDEEDVSLKKERCALQVWFAEEWAVVNLAIQQTSGMRFTTDCRAALADCCSRFRCCRPISTRVAARQSGAIVCYVAKMPSEPGRRRGGLATLGTQRRTTLKVHRACSFGRPWRR